MMTPLSLQWITIVLQCHHMLDVSLIECACFMHFLSFQVQAGDSTKREPNQYKYQELTGMWSNLEALWFVHPHLGCKIKECTGTLFAGQQLVSVLDPNNPITFRIRAWSGTELRSQLYMCLPTDCPRGYSLGDIALDKCSHILCYLVTTFLGEMSIDNTCMQPGHRIYTSHGVWWCHTHFHGRWCYHGCTLLSKAGL